MMYWKLSKNFFSPVIFTIFSTPMFICEAVIMAIVFVLNFFVLYLTSGWFERLDDANTEKFQKYQERVTGYIRKLKDAATEASKPPEKSKSKISTSTIQKAKRDKLKHKVHFLLNTTPSEYVRLDRQRQQEGAKLLSFLYSLTSIVDKNRDWDLGAVLSEMSMRNSVISMYKNIEMRSSYQMLPQTSSLSFRSIFGEDGKCEDRIEISSSESFVIKRENKSGTSYV